MSNGITAFFGVVKGIPTEPCTRALRLSLLIDKRIRVFHADPDPKKIVDDILVIASIGTTYKHNEAGATTEVDTVFFQFTKERTASGRFVKGLEFDGETFTLLTSRLDSKSQDNLTVDVLVLEEPAT